MSRARPVPWERMAAGWLVAATALLPLVEFLERGAWGYATAAAIVSTAAVLGTSLAVLASVPAGWTPAGGAAAAWLAAALAGASVSAAANGAIPAAASPISILGGGTAGFLLLAGWGSRPGPGRALARGLAAGGAIAGVWALAQVQGGIEVPAQQLAELRSRAPLLAEQVEARIGEGRAFSFFVYPSALAGYLVLALPFCVAGWLEVGRARWGWGISAALVLGGLAASGSIGGVSALAVSVVAWAIASRRRLYAPIAGALALLAVVLALRGPAALGAGASSKIAHWRGMVTAPSSVLSAAVGTGPGSYAAAARSAMPSDVWARYAHDWPLEVWIEQGMAGLIPLAGFLVAGLAGWLRLVTGNPGRLGNALAVAWLAGLVHRLVDIDYVLPAVSFPWFCLSGWLAAAALRGPEARKRGPSWGWQRIAPGLFRAARPWFLVALVLPLPFLKGTPAVLWTCAVFGVATAVVWTARSAGTMGPVAGRLDVPWAGLLVLSGVWALVSPRPDESWTALFMTVGLIAVVFAVRGLARSDARAEPTMRAATGIATIGAAAWGIVEAVAEHRPATAGFPSPSFLGAFLVFGGGLSLASMAGSRGARRVLAAVALAAAAGGIAATQSRGSELAACAIATGWLGVRAFRDRGARRMAAFAGAAGCILVASWGVSRIDPLSIDQRLVMWHEASRLLAGAPQGRGPGSYAAEVLRVKEPSITASGVGRYSLFAQFAHCEPLQFAVEWGVVGLGLLVLGLVLAWAAGGRGAGPAWRLALAGVLVHGLVDFPLRAPPILVLAAVAVGFMTSGERSARKAGNRRLPAGATAALIILGCWLAVEVARPGLARWGREHGRPPDALFDPAIPRAMAAIEMEPRDPWEWMKAGDMLRARGRRAAAREAYRRAIDREPFCLDAYVRLGELARAGGDRREAGRWFRRALILRARLVQRPGLNDYEKELIGYPSEWESRVRGLLLDAGGGK